MRIVTWNCGMALARKAPNLLALKPDITVVRECAKNSVDVLHSHGFSGPWFGAKIMAETDRRWPANRCRVY